MPPPPILPAADSRRDRPWHLTLLASLAVVLVWSGQGARDWAVIGATAALLLLPRLHDRELDRLA